LTRPEGKLIIQKQYYQQRVMERARPMFAIASAAIAGAGTLQQAVAQDSAFYSGKTLNLVVGYSAGGGYDQYARPRRS
jgi:tripartite-type tricarboxylate transporter receptor subunit TctC